MWHLGEQGNLVEQRSGRARHRTWCTRGGNTSSTGSREGVNQLDNQFLKCLRVPANSCVKELRGLHWSCAEPCMCLDFCDPLFDHYINSPLFCMCIFRRVIRGHCLVWAEHHQRLWWALVLSSWTLIQRPPDVILQFGGWQPALQHFSKTTIYPRLQELKQVFCLDGTEPNELVWQQMNLWKWRKMLQNTMWKRIRIAHKLLL